MKKINKYLDKLVMEAIESILMSIVGYKYATIGYSGGKDSSLLVNLVLLAFKIGRERGLQLPILIVHTNNTQIENPDVFKYLMVEQTKIENYCIDNSINFQITTAIPALTEHWAVSILTGRKLPTYPEKQTADCSIDFKVKPGAKLIKGIMKSKGLELSDNLFLLGTRLTESTVRKGNMLDRGESNETIALNSKTGDSFAPVANWESEEVWALLLAAETKEKCLSNGMTIQTYSDFIETFRIYDDASSSEGCHTFGDVKASKGCGSRHGCWACCRVENNKSLKSMLDNNDERYGYMAPLYAIQQFLVKSRFDWSLRNPIGRSVSEHGFINMQPDTLHPSVLEMVFKACLTVDRDSAEEQHKLGLSKPKIEQILNLERIAYIDALWSLRGYFEPFHAWKLVKDIYSYNSSFYFDETEKTEKTPLPKKRFIDVRKMVSKHINIEHVWGTKFSLREGMMFLEDGDHYDFYTDKCHSEMSFASHEKIDLFYQEKVQSKLKNSIQINVEHLEEFLVKHIGFPETLGLNGLFSIANATFDCKTTKHWSYGRCKGFLAYLDHGILIYNKGQKKWIENTIKLSLARNEIFGSWDVPTYNDAISKSLESLPEEIQTMIDHNDLFTTVEIEEPELFDFSELDLINVKVVEPKESKRKVNSAFIKTDLHNQTSMFF